MDLSYLQVWGYQKDKSEIISIFSQGKHMFTISKEGSHHIFMKNYPLIIPFMPFLSRACLLYFYVLENKQNRKKKKC